MIKTLLASPYDGEALAVEEGLGGSYTLITESFLKLNAHWRSAVNDTAETINIVTPLPNESILLTDLIITSSRKVSTSTLIVQFCDGINTEILTEMEGATSPIEFSHSFSGGLRGWKDAILQVVTDQIAVNVTTLVGYVKIPARLTKTYNVWDSER